MLATNNILLKIIFLLTLFLITENSYANQETERETEQKTEQINKEKVLKKEKEKVDQYSNYYYSFGMSKMEECRSDVRNDVEEPLNHKYDYFYYGNLSAGIKNGVFRYYTFADYYSPNQNNYGVGIDFVFDLFDSIPFVSFFLANWYAGVRQYKYKYTAGGNDMSGENLGFVMGLTTKITDSFHIEYQGILGADFFGSYLYLTTEKYTYFITEEWNVKFVILY